MKNFLPIFALALGVIMLSQDRPMADLAAGIIFLVSGAVFTRQIRDDVR